ncbi:hypothetical protein AB0E04_44775 [Streptomyces sp. NPDC048251]|uniref:hypothetical protein n=1 Tax=Streptomyces sp. NPDC048251 TaxID=3154501 RepID=UPI00342684A5
MTNGSGGVSYGHSAARAATFLHTALLLRPFTGYNLVIGRVCTGQYMHLSGEPLQPGRRPVRTRQDLADRRRISKSDPTDASTADLYH